MPSFLCLQKALEDGFKESLSATQKQTIVFSVETQTKLFEVVKE